MMKKSSKSDFLIKEDYWAIWIGTFLLIVGLIIFYFIPQQNISASLEKLHSTKVREENYPLKTVDWYLANDDINSMTSANSEIGKLIKTILKHPQKWKNNPLIAFYKSDTNAELLTKSNTLALSEKKVRMDFAEVAARNAFYIALRLNFQDENVNQEYDSLLQSWHKQKVDYVEQYKKAVVKPYNLLESQLVLAIFLALIFAVGAHFMGVGARKFIVGFTFVFLVAVLSQLLGNQAEMKNLGFGFALWAIVIGLLISNTIGTPKWVIPAAQTEYYIKTGLVLLGAEILFGKILAIGLPGIFVAWVVTPIVLICTYWFGQNILKIASKTLNITISADMSVCGVSAAIATAAACKAKKEELTLAVGLSMVFTAIMMVALPAFIKAVGMPEILGGAWIGGTIDATGAVVAAGAFLGDKALNVAATIKMIQNMLIGVIAFFVALYWTVKVDREKGIEVKTSEIWIRFPKFIVGFVAASILFSLLYSLSGNDLANATVENGVIGGFTKDLREWFFCLAFVSIGLSVNFRELQKYFKGGKPLILYLCGQAFNLILTLLMAYLMFYMIFPDITAKI